MTTADMDGFITLFLMLEKNILIRQQGAVVPSETTGVLKVGELIFRDGTLHNAGVEMFHAHLVFFVINSF